MVPQCPCWSIPVVHTGLSVNSSLPSSTPSSARLPRRVPQPVPLWVSHASIFTATPAAPGSLLAPAAVVDDSFYQRPSLIYCPWRLVCNGVCNHRIDFIYYARSSTRRRTGPPPICDVDFRNALFADELVDSDSLWAQRRNVHRTAVPPRLPQVDTFDQSRHVAQLRTTANTLLHGANTLLVTGHTF